MVINIVDGRREITLCIIITISSLVHIAMRLLHSFKCLSYLHFSWEEWEIYRWSSEFCISIFIKIFYIKILRGLVILWIIHFPFCFPPLTFIFASSWRWKKSEICFSNKENFFYYIFALSSLLSVCKISTYCTVHTTLCNHLRTFSLSSFKIKFENQFESFFLLFFVWKTFSSLCNKKNARHKHTLYPTCIHFLSSSSSSSGSSCSFYICRDKNRIKHCEREGEGSRRKLFCNNTADFCFF